MTDEGVPPADTRPAVPHIDTSVPHSARFWNYMLGGKDNYAPDQEVGEYIKAHHPGLVDVARCSRRFLGRAVRFLVNEQGVRQFLDVGTGLPTAGNTHEVAQQADPTARIVYVDNDPLVLAHASALLKSSPEGATDYLDADVREPEEILRRAAKTLDLSQPVALVLMGIMGHIEDIAEVKDLIRRYLGGLPSGSYLVHYDGTSTSEAMLRAQEDYRNSGAVPYYVRTVAEVEAAFEGLELVEPGVVRVTDWRPDGPEEVVAPPVDAYGGVARKP
ncbi:SAM-dependent methyltransferase [Streptomyces sp. 7-21]|uniref:SAM-dependent methyltransferase n=1 Tax=Streptomyces sp. 7-21 TaxID=2802283 RepID=UPI00191DBEB1|nr:SAM-dependent methyltransferase [Streptomyces sp. 7-21]MBL1066189.1 SAM-dependent methyltransferase [Streptomyces sp. 7-21]